MKSFLHILFIIILPFFVKGQIITTICGNGSAGYSGDGSMASIAVLNNPHGLFGDTANNIYIADHQNSRIRKINNTGIINTIVGNGTYGFSGDGGYATTAQISYPYSMVVDKLGNVYVSDNYNNRIRKLTSGIINSIVGTGTGTYSGDGGLATAASLHYNGSIALDAGGNLYIADQYNHRIRKVNNITGIITTIAGTGIPGYSGDGSAASLAQLHYPNYIRLDNLGNIYITDNGNSCIRKIDTFGIITTIAGNGIAGFSGDGGMAISAQLNFPGGIAISASGNLIIADNVNNRVREVKPSGVISTIAGIGTAGYTGDYGNDTDAELNNPVDVCYDASGNILIADYLNNCIRKISMCNINITTQPLPDTVTSGTNSKFYVTTTNPTATYQWQEDPGTGFVNLANVWPYNGVATDTLTIHNTSIYLNLTHYRCIVSTGAGCTDTSNGAILVVHSSVGLASIDFSEKVKVFPNPTNNQINLTLPNYLANVYTELLNNVGQIIIQSNFSGYMGTLDIHNLATGVYILKIKTADEVIYQKIIKE